MAERLPLLNHEQGYRNDKRQGKKAFTIMRATFRPRSFPEGYRRRYVKVRSWLLRLTTSLTSDTCESDLSFLWMR